MLKHFLFDQSTSLTIPARLVKICFAALAVLVLLSACAKATPQPTPGLDQALLQQTLQALDQTATAQAIFALTLAAPTATPPSTATFTPVPSSTPTTSLVLNPPPANPPPAATETPFGTPFTGCPGAPTTHLYYSAVAIVCTKSDRVKVRSEPNNEASVVELLSPGSRVYIIGGPACANNWTWYKVTYAPDQVGWVAEGGDARDPYFICPLK